MPAKVSTFRIEPTVQTGLENLSRVLKRPMNQLVNVAVKDYVRRRSSEVERDLESTLASLRAYRERDPDFEQAIATFARAEARHGKDDPAEGKVVVGKLVNGQLIEEQSSGPIETEYASSSMADWDADSPELHDNLIRASACRQLRHRERESNARRSWPHRAAISRTARKLFDPGRPRYVINDNPMLSSS